MRIACFITLQQMKEALKAADMALKVLLFRPAELKMDRTQTCSCSSLSGSEESQIYWDRNFLSLGSVPN